MGPSWAESGQSEHEGIETSSRCCLSLGRDDMLHPVLHGHCLGRVAERSGDCVTSTTPSTSSLREAHASEKAWPKSESEARRIDIRKSGVSKSKDIYRYTRTVRLINYWT